MVRYKTGLKMSEKEVKVSLWKQYKEMRVGLGFLQSPVYQEGRLSNSSSRYRRIFFKQNNYFRFFLSFLFSFPWTFELMFESLPFYVDEKNSVYFLNFQSA